MTRLDDFDWDAHRCTWDRWWARDLERPIVLTRPWLASPAEAPAWWGRQLGGVPAEVTPEEIAAIAEAGLAARTYEADDFPKFWVDFGPGVLSACLGGDLHAAGSTWFTPGIHAGKAIREVVIPERVGGRWWERVQAVTRAATARFGTRAVVACTDLGGNLDILASLRDSNQALLDCMDDPEEVDRLCRTITARWWEAYEAQSALIEPCGRGTSAWAPIWSSQRCYMLQSDFAYMIGPKQFARWVVPDLADLCGRMPHGFYHLDGKGQLPHLDLLLAVPGLQGVQWIPGDGNPQAAEAAWWPVLQRIRAAGKLVQIFSPGSAMLKLAAELPTDGYVLAASNDIPGMSDAELAAAIQREAAATRRRLRPQIAMGTGVATFMAEA